MPPANDDISTATNIPSLDYSNIQSDIHDAGTTYEVWYKYTALADDGVINLNIRGAGTYTPAIWLYVDDITGALGIVTANLMTQIPLIAGRVYYFRIIPNIGNPSPAVLTIELTKFVRGIRQADDIFIRSASILPAFLSEGYTGVAGATINPVTGAIRDLEPQFITGESGDYLPTTGELCFADEFNSPFTAINIYNSSDLSLRATVTYDWSQGFPVIRTSREQNLFYIGDKGSAPTKNIGYFTIDRNGVSTAEVLMVGFGMTAMANSADDLSVYVAGVGGSVGAAIKQWDKTGAAFGADFAAGVANHVVQDILVMRTGEVVALYHQAATDSIFVRVYDTAGAVLRTYTAPVVAYTSVAPRLGYANDDSLSFWLFLHQSDEFSRFIQIQLSDVAELTSITTPSSDYFSSDHGTTPAHLFVASDSCPFVLLLAAEDGPASGIYIIVTNKRNDIGEAIPTPTFKTALMP